MNRICAYASSGVTLASSAMNSPTCDSPSEPTGASRLIGSRAKRQQFERRLDARGVASAAMSRVTCPIGRGALKSKEPGVIAVSVAAEILAIREAVQ